MKVCPQTTLLLHPCGGKVNHFQSERIYPQEAGTPEQSAAYFPVCMGIVDPVNHNWAVHSVASIGSNSLVRTDELHTSRCTSLHHITLENGIRTPPVFLSELFMEMQGLLAVCVNSFVSSFAWAEVSTMPRSRSWCYITDIPPGSVSLSIWD